MEETTEAMIRFGGSFVQSLGKLYRQADDDNRHRLVAAFPHYFSRYRQIAAQEFKRDAR